MTEVTADSTRAAELREALITELWKLDALRTDAVEQAVRTVPRHVFAPEVTLEQAYAAERAEVIKRDERGVALSSVSAARIQAFMLEQADLRPGMRVLEIGSGGYNAALMAELVGEAGEVTTIDIDSDVVDRARRLLSEAGYERVNALVVDGAEGEPEHAPYDRIVVTVEATELASAWVAQLAEDGRIVVPLRIRGLTRSVAFHRQNDHLVARDYEMCGFVPMQGAGADPQQLVVLHDGEGEQVALRLDDGHQLDSEPLHDALFDSRAEAWSEMTMPPGSPYDELELWLATHLPRYALLATTRQARERDLVASWSPMGVSTLLDEDGTAFAYLAIRPTSPERDRFEFGAIAHGPNARTTAERFVTEIQAWDAGHRQQQAEFRAYPAETSDEQLPAGCVLDGAAFRITISWPAADL